MGIIVFVCNGGQLLSALVGLIGNKLANSVKWQRRFGILVSVAGIIGAMQILLLRPIPLWLPLSCLLDLILLFLGVILIMEAA